MNGHEKQKEQSRNMIEEAMLLLMEKKSFHDITVTELVKKADVARRTFYRLYEGKEDVLRTYFERLCREYREEHPPLPSYNVRQISRDYFSFWYRHRRLLLVMHRSGLDAMLYYEISRASSEVVKSRIGSEEQKNTPEAGCFAAYSVGGFSLLLHLWIENGMAEPPEAYAEKVGEALSGFIRPVSV